MAHISLPEGLPGIRGLMAYRPETAGPLNALAEVLLRGDNTLSRGERELIATYVSSLNECRYCQNVHGAVASHYLEDGNGSLVDQVKANFAGAPISPRLKTLLAIAASVQRGGKQVTAAQVDAARAAGATDTEIHDAVLIAAAFCLFNRYVDGLGTWAPDDPAVYRERAGRLAETGYAASNPYK
jgi:uncharacterized peroxidase-related enzyme